MSPTSKLTSFLLVLAGAVAALGASPAAQAQDAAQGKKKAAMCIGCHGIPGYQASFPEVYKVPMISGQNTEYIVSALTAYKKGERKHSTMRGIAASLTDADMADLAAFYHQYGVEGIAPVAETAPAPASPEVAALVAKGACVSCHGANFSKPVAPNYPKLAGQHPDYLYAALKAYATEGNPQVGRANAIMGAQVKAFNHRELKAIAQYVASLPGEIRTTPASKFR
jgi:cytochrome c553